LAESPFTILNKQFQSETFDGITNLLECLPDCHKATAPAVQASDSGGQELVIRDDVSGGNVTQAEYLIAKYASQSKLNKRSGNKLIALASRADLIPVELARKGFQYLSFELLEQNGQRVFKPANSGVWWQVSASELGSDNVLLAFVVFEDASIATHTCEPLNYIFAVMP